MSKPKIIAFYLPQYHPIKENNEWYGEGFTEWTNVGKTRPLFKGHDQPKVPADLGYYDLRIPEVREKQAELAKEAGIDAFCYYHYWFGNGKKIMEMPLEEVVKLGKPNFPFMVCWANHSFFNKSWNNDTKKLDQTLLIEQKYPGEQDIIEHFHYLLPMFKDQRYFKIDNKLPFLIYDIKSLDKEYFILLKNKWKDLAKKNGLPEFLFMGYTYDHKDINKEIFLECDAMVYTPTNNVFLNGNYSRNNFRKRKILEIAGKLLKRNVRVKKYKDAIKHLKHPIEKEEKVFPVIIPNWDRTPRRGYGADILKDSTPELFALHVKDILEITKLKKDNNQIIFLKSWNEWGEGNYMEPDLKFGKGYIHALRKALSES